MRRPDPKVSPDAARTAWEAKRPPTAPDPVRARCKLITPMYGGGVKPGQVDRELPIRPGALRGQLRFWWRLLNGTGRTPQELFRVECALWGGISSQGPRASHVTLEVKAAPVEDRHLVTWKSKIGSYPGYALILERNDDPVLLKDGWEFDLMLHFTRKVTGPQREQVIEALRWWASFAGVGARTRRGLGAVRVAGNDAELKAVSIEEVRSRGGWMVPGQPTGRDAVKAWKDAVERLRSFRQGRGIGRNPGAGNRPGRSRWPEPDAIRRLAGHHAAGHEPQHPVDGFYPRAAFGLPIVFHFKDGARGDPEDCTLTSDGRDRMASPLILRPWFDGEQYRPLALLLPGWEERLSVPVGLDSDSDSAGSVWPSDVAERAKMTSRIGPMRDHRGHGDDPLSAFMHYFEHG